MLWWKLSRFAKVSEFNEMMLNALSLHQFVSYNLVPIRSDVVSLDTNYNVFIASFLLVCCRKRRDSLGKSSTKGWMEKIDIFALLLFYLNEYISVLLYLHIYLYLYPYLGDQSPSKASNSVLGYYLSQNGTSSSPMNSLTTSNLERNQAHYRSNENSVDALKRREDKLTKCEDMVAKFLEVINYYCIEYISL